MSSTFSKRDHAAGLLKAILVLEHGEIPPTLHFSAPNPRIDFAASPFYVASKLQPWPASEMPRRAGVSSFGVGGTNAHVVLEEAPPVAAPATVAQPQLLVISAKSASALDEATNRLAEHLRAHPEFSMADTAYTLQTGRRAFRHRRAWVSRTVNKHVEGLPGNDVQELIVAVIVGPGELRTISTRLRETHPCIRQRNSLEDDISSDIWD